VVESKWPKVEVMAVGTNYTRFRFAPLGPGYGQTLGNSLRRILLSSLPGSAVTHIRINNIYHEFSSLPSVKEDVTEIVLNVKKIRLRSFSERAVQVRLSVSEGGEVKAGDIETSSQVEIVNPELVLAHLDGDNGHLEMELTVERGRGYYSSDGRENPTIGLIPVDAIFSPVPRVNYMVEFEADADDPQQQNESLLLEVWTDGTIEPADALSQAAQVMVQHTSLIANFKRGLGGEREIAHGIIASIPSHVAETTIEQLNLSVRTYNCLKRSSITKVGQILQMDRKDLMAVRNFGDKSYDELRLRLAERGFLPPDSDLAVDLDKARAAQQAEGASLTDDLDEEESK